MQKRILLLDNDGDLLRLADDMMYYGYSDVYITADCNSVLTIAKGISPDIIILDFLLIKQEGMQICETIKADKNFKDVPLILISACQNKQMDMSAYGYDAHFVKPFDTGQLALAIHYLVAAPKAA